ALYFEALDASLSRRWAPLVGVVQDRWKYIDLPIRELYDLSADPGEATNRSDGEPAVRERLAHLLDPLVSAASAAGPASRIDGEAAGRLRALGYVGGGAAVRAKPYAADDDPKRLVSLNERFNSAVEWVNEGHAAKALAALRALLVERPDFITARTSAATLLLDEHRAREAAALLEAAPADDGPSPEILAKLGAARRDAGDLRGAAEAFERAQQLGDQNPELFNDLGVVYARLRRDQDARAMFLTLLHSDP